MDLITVILPVYNVAPYLRKTLDSVLAQTYPDLEILLIDDGSTDESAKICDDYASTNKNLHVIHKNNGGVSSARNLGIVKAKGEYITFIDSDDIVEPDMIEQMYNNAITYKVPLSCCRMDVVEINGKSRKLDDGTSGRYTKDDILNRYFTDQFIKDQFYGPVNKLFHRNLICRSFFKPYSLGEDILFMFETLLKVDNVYISDYVGYHYVHRAGSAMTSSFSLKRLDYIYAGEEMLRISKGQYPKISCSLEKWLFVHTIVTLRQINMTQLKNKCSQFYYEHKTMLLKQRTLFYQLPAMRKLDYLGVVIFPFYFKILKLIKQE